jgi:hypothetical protein
MIGFFWSDKSRGSDVGFHGTQKCHHATPRVDGRSSGHGVTAKAQVGQGRRRMVFSRGPLAVDALLLGLTAVDGLLPMPTTADGLPVAVRRAGAWRGGQAAATVKLLTPSCGRVRTGQD